MSRQSVSGHPKTVLINSVQSLPWDKCKSSKNKLQYPLDLEVNMLFH